MTKTCQISRQIDVSKVQFPLNSSFRPADCQSFWCDPNEIYRPTNLGYHCQLGDLQDILKSYFLFVTGIHKRAAVFAAKKPSIAAHKAAPSMHGAPQPCNRLRYNARLPPDLCDVARVYLSLLAKPLASLVSANVTSAQMQTYL